MLFDLTGRGRRRTVRIVYSALALIFLLGFVGFGVGSFGGGGFFEALSGKGSNNSVSYQSQLNSARKLTVTQPNNPGAWSGLIHATLLQAGTGENYVSNGVEGGFTQKAHSLLVDVESAWQRYLKLNPHHPSADVANEVMRVYASPGGLTNPKAALQAWKIVVASRPPSTGLYSTLAIYAYQAGDKHLGESAAAKAIKLAPPGEKTIIENELAKAKRNPYGSAETGGSQTVTVPASSLKGAKTKGGTVTIPASALPKGATVGKGASTTGTSTAPAPAKK
jgi:hypothetical protein